MDRIAQGPLRYGSCQSCILATLLVLLSHVFLCHKTVCSVGAGTGFVSAFHCVAGT